MSREPINVVEVLDRLVREVPMGSGHIQAITEARAVFLELTEAAHGIIGTDGKPDRYGYGAAHNAMNDEKRNRLITALAPYPVDHRTDAQKDYDDKFWAVDAMLRGES